MGRIIIHNTNINRFETNEDGVTAYVEYEPFENGMNLTHTIVPKPIEGRGIAAELVCAALDYARANGLEIIATCSYVAVYIKRHPEYADFTLNVRQ